MTGNAERNKKMREIIGCLGEYDFQGEFECGYENAPVCEDCVYGCAGGNINPETGKLK